MITLMMELKFFIGKVFLKNFGEMNFLKKAKANTFTIKSCDF